MKKVLKTPHTRLNWHLYYKKQWIKNQSDQALQLSIWYQLLYMEFGN